MKREQVIKIFEQKTNVKKKIEVTVSYRIGGMNYFTGTSYPKGYYLAVQPYESGENFRSFTAFAGINALLETANRYSAKTLAQISSDITDEQIKPLMDAVLAKMNSEESHFTEVK